MEKLLVINDKKVPYIVRNSKRTRRLRLSVYRDCSVVLTLPRSYDQSRVEKFLMEKSDWIEKKLDYFKQFNGQVYKMSDKAEYLKYKDAAKRLVTERLEHFNKFYKFKYNRVSIKDQKTRWGSCSKKRNLNFNYRLAVLPPALADYIVVHELCHLKEFNHSKKFWDQVARAVPNYIELRRELNTRHVLIG